MRDFIGARCVTHMFSSSHCVQIASTTRIALNYAKKMKAEAPVLRQTLIHELVQEFFHATSFPRIQRPTRRRIPLDRTVTPDDPRLASHHLTHDRDDRATDHMAHRYCAARPSMEVARTALLKLLVDMLSAYPECLKVTRGPATIAPIDLVMMVLLVFEFHEKLPAPRLADTPHALHMAVRKETKDLMWKTEHTGFYLVFLDRLERLGEAALNSGSGKDAPVAMYVDQPPKQQRTGGT